MKLTKFDHACFVVEKHGRSLIVDPGNLTGNLTRLKNVDGIVITHQHPDHYDMGIITAIMDDNPTAQIFTTTAVAPDVSMYDVHIARPGETRHAGKFLLRFYGGEHALIHTSIPPIDNIGVLVEDSLYYPGDSFATPDRAVHTLLLPIAAPWLNINDSLTFAEELHAEMVIPTHDAILAPTGITIVDSLANTVVSAYGGTYVRPHHPIDLV